MHQKAYAPLGTRTRSSVTAHPIRRSGNDTSGPRLPTSVLETKKGPTQAGGVRLPRFEAEQQTGRQAAYTGCDSGLVTGALAGRAR